MLPWKKPKIVKLTISNIAWAANQENDVFSLLPLYGVTAVEVAPTRIWPEWEYGAKEVVAYRNFLQDHGLVCSSLQAILYQQPHLKVFGTATERADLIAHLKRVANLAADLGARAMVFGAPKNRDRGDLDEQTAMEQAADLFAIAGEYCHQNQVCLCLEPNPVNYGCNFITNSQSGAELVRLVNSPGFRLHLDAAGMHLAGEEPSLAITAAADVLEHIHVSEPNLGTFSQPQVNHAHIAAALRNIGWEQWISIEMRATEQPIESIKEALTVVKAIYSV